MVKIVFLQVCVLIFNLFIFPFNDNSLQAQPATTDSSVKSFRLFEDDRMLEISLRFDLSTYLRAKPRKDYLKANLTIMLSPTDSISRDIKLKTRGIFRNQHCTFAPIELNIKNSEFGYADLDKISKLKLVPQCSSGKEREEYIFREYLAYKLFNTFTDTSFRVRLLKINYIDTQKKRKIITQYGFFIEPVEIIAARTNCIQIKLPTITQLNIIPRIMDRLAIFNYMIGNYDWSVPGQHNVSVLKSLIVDPYGLGIAIPHDFDWSGLVNASYAIPAENVGTQTVRERIFGGVCRKKEVYQKELEPFLQKKDEMYRVINEFPYINQRVKKDMTGYLDEFFNQLIGRRDLILYTLLNSCKPI